MEVSSCHFVIINARKVVCLEFDLIVCIFLLKKTFFAAARMRLFFVTRCAGNKAIFSFGLPYSHFSLSKTQHLTQAIAC